MTKIIFRLLAVFLIGIIVDVSYASHIAPKEKVKSETGTFSKMEVSNSVVLAEAPVFTIFGNMPATALNSKMYFVALTTFAHIDPGSVSFYKTLSTASKNITVPDNQLSYRYNYFKYSDKNLVYHKYVKSKNISRCRYPNLC